MSKTLQFSVFTNLRLASEFYTPAHSKNGVNVSQRLQVNAYLNENRRGSAEDKSEAISLTAWGKGADILAWTLTPGKEFTVFADLNVYKAPVYHNNQPVSINGEVLMRKAYGYTIRRFDLGNDSFKHIMDEIQRGARGVNWWVKGSPDAQNFKATLDARMAQVGTFNAQANAQSFGFANVKLPAYSYSAFVPNQPAAMNQPSATPVGAATTPEAVAASFGAIPKMNAPINPAQSFVMPQVQVAPQFAAQTSGGMTTPGISIPAGV